MTDGAEDTARAGPGTALKAAREGLGYTVQDMADALNLTARVVDDLENERWNRLPAAAFARGYVRTYARLVGLDGDKLLEGYAGLGEAEAETKTRKTGVGPMTRVGPAGLVDLAAQQPGTVISGAVIAAVCVVLVVLYLVWPESNRRESPGPAVASVPARTSTSGGYVPGAVPRRPLPSRPVSPADAVTPAPESVTAAPASAPVSEPQAAVSEPQAAEPTALAGSTTAPQPELSEPAPLDAVAVEAAVDAGAEPEAVTEVAEAVPPPPRAPESRVRRISPEGEDRMSFQFTEDCWVEVADADGRQYSDLARAGDSLELIGRAPFQVRLGYGPGASLAFNGRTIALEPHTRRTNVTALTLDPNATAAPGD